jgi:hypothetical protein
MRPTIFTTRRTPCLRLLVSLHLHSRLQLSVSISHSPLVIGRKVPFTIHYLRALHSSLMLSSGVSLLKSITPFAMSSHSAMTTKTHLLSRTRVSPTGWYSASDTACACALPLPNALQDAHRSRVLGGRVDDKHPRLHSRQVMASHGSGVSHHPPYDLPPQLWPLHRLDGLDVWYAP